MVTFLWNVGVATEKQQAGNETNEFEFQCDGIFFFFSSVHVKCVQNIWMVFVCVYAL